MPLKRKKLFIIRLLLTLLFLGLALQAFVWPRFKGVKVYDTEDDFTPRHNVETYWDDDLDREVNISWSRRDLCEFSLIQAASWEALERDKRGEIFITSAREACSS